jgi:phospholipid/cholesterol/gamma-HCH transport system substrate-binding protein
MEDYKKNVLIGVFVIAAAILITWGLLFLEPTLGDSEQILRVRFDNIEKVGVGTRVTFAGKPVGEVVSISEVYGAREEADNTQGEVYFYELELEVDSSVKVYDTDDIVIRSSGLLGEKNISILPRPSLGDKKPEIINDRIIYANKTGSIEHALEELTELAIKARSALDNIIDVVEENSVEVNATIKAMRGTFEGMDALLDVSNDSGLAYNFNNAVVSFDATLNNLNSGLDSLHENRFWDKLALATNNVSDLSEDMSKSWPKLDKSFDNIAKITSDLQGLSSLVNNVDTIAQQIAEGKGSLGGFIMKDDIYLRSMSVIGKVDTIINDVNHYGILFQNNKNWQRQRIKRMNELNSLESPRSMRLYFDKEVSEIHAAMGRLSTLLKNMEISPHRNNSMFDNEVFAKEFSGLLRQARGLESTLRLYNEEFANKKNKD